MTVFDPGWDDETPDEEPEPPEEPEMAPPEAIVLNDDNPGEPDWARDNAPGWRPV